MEHLFIIFIKNLGKLFWKQYGTSQLYIKALLQITPNSKFLGPQHYIH